MTDDGYDPNTSNAPLLVETRTTSPRQLFWFWVASGLTVACTPGGVLIAATLGSVWASLLAILLGLALAGVVLAIVSLAGLRSGRATLALSTEVFGRRGNLLPLVVSYLVLMGWCAISSVLVVHSVEAMLHRFGIPPSDRLRLIILAVFSVALVVLVWIGYRLIQATQKWIAFAVGICCAAMGIYAAVETDWSALPAPTLSPQMWLAAFVIALTNGASGWWNAGADFSRFLRADTAGRSAVSVTIIGMCGVVVVVMMGVLIYFYRPTVLHASNPVIEATREVPLLAVVLGLIVVTVGLHASAVTNLYSASLNLNTLGLRSRVLALAVCTVLVIGIALWVLFGSTGFYGWFASFLTVLGVPLAAWAGVFIVPVLDGRGWPPVGPAVVVGALAWMVAGMALGFGFLQSATEGMRWVGYLAPDSAFSSAGGGVLVAILVSFVGAWTTRRWWLAPLGGER